MPIFGSDSNRKLEGVHPDLVLICREAIKHYDFKVLCGVRDLFAQNDVFNRGMSKVKFPDSKHNIITNEEARQFGLTPRPLALAVDLAPWPIDWAQDKVSRFFYLAGVIQTVASVLTMHIRWGHDFNQNQNFYDQNFIDAPHFELVRGRDHG